MSNNGPYGHLLVLGRVGTKCLRDGEREPAALVLAYVAEAGVKLVQAGFPTPACGTIEDACSALAALQAEDDGALRSEVIFQLAHELDLSEERPLGGGEVAEARFDILVRATAAAVNWGVLTPQCRRRAEKAAEGYIPDSRLLAYHRANPWADPTGLWTVVSQAQLAREGGDKDEAPEPRRRDNRRARAAMRELKSSEE